MRKELKGEIDVIKEIHITYATEVEKISSAAKAKFIEVEDVDTENNVLQPCFRYIKPQDDNLIKKPLAVMKPYRALRFGNSPARKRGTSSASASSRVKLPPISPARTQLR